MAQHFSDRDRFRGKDDLRNQPVLVPLDVENHAIALGEGRTPVLLLHLRRFAPICLLHFAVPRQKRLLGVGVIRPEGPKGAFRDDPHRSKYKVVPSRMQVQ